jgi:hypothetical protein
LKEQLRLEEDALQQIVDGPLARYRAIEEHLLEQRKVAQTSSSDHLTAVSHLYRTQGPRYATEAVCVICECLISLTSYLPQLPKESFDLIFDFLCPVKTPYIAHQTDALQAFASLRRSCKTLYNKFLSWKPKENEWKMNSVVARTRSASNFSQCSHLTVEVVPSADSKNPYASYPQVNYLTCLLAGPGFARTFRKVLTFYLVCDAVFCYFYNFYLFPSGPQF